MIFIWILKFDQFFTYKFLCFKCIRLLLGIIIFHYMDSIILKQLLNQYNNNIYIIILYRYQYNVYTIQYIQHCIQRTKIVRFCF